MHLDKVRELALIDHVPELVEHRSEQLIKVAAPHLPDLVSVIATFGKRAKAFLEDRLSVRYYEEMDQFDVAFALGI